MAFNPDGTVDQQLCHRCKKQLLCHRCKKQLIPGEIVKAWSRSGWGLYHKKCVPPNLFHELYHPNEIVGQLLSGRPTAAEASPVPSQEAQGSAPAAGPGGIRQCIIDMFAAREPEDNRDKILSDEESR